MKRALLAIGLAALVFASEARLFAVVAIAKAAVFADSVDRTSYNITTDGTNGFTVTNGGLEVMCLVWSKASAPDAITSITDSGHGLTWHQQSSVISFDTSGTPLRKMAMYSAYCNGCTTTAQVPVVSFGANTETSLNWTVYEFTGTDVANTGENAQFVQFQSGFQDSAVTSTSLTFANLGAGGNAMIGCGAETNPGTGTLSGQSGWTNAAATDLSSQATPAVKMWAQYTVGSGNGLTVAWTATTTNIWAAIGAEIKALVVPATSKQLMLMGVGDHHLELQR